MRADGADVVKYTGLLLLLPTIIGTGWTQDNELLSSLMKTPYYKQLTEAYENLDVDALYMSYLHGANCHRNRTAGS